MPGLIKIGYSLKDPKLRAAELNHTGSPYPYEVEYEILIPYPRDIEQELHLILNDKRAGKEWFYIDANEVIEIIRKNYGEQIILESKLILESKSITKFAERKWHYDPETASLKNNETEEELSQFQYNVFHQLIITNNHQQISFHEIDGEQHINKFLRIQKGIKHSKSTWVFDLRNKIVIGMSDGKIIPWRPRKLSATPDFSVRCCRYDLLRTQH